MTEIAKCKLKIANCKMGQWRQLSASFLLAAALFGPSALFFIAGPLGAAIAALAAMLLYLSWRNHIRGFGPLWLEIVDIAVIVGNGALFLVSCVQLFWS